MRQTAWLGLVRVCSHREVVENLLRKVNGRRQLVVDWWKSKQFMAWTSCGWNRCTWSQWWGSMRRYEAFHQIAEVQRLLIALPKTVTSILVISYKIWFTNCLPNKTAVETVRITWRPPQSCRSRYNLILQFWVIKERRALFFWQIIRLEKEVGRSCVEKNRTRVDTRFSLFCCNFFCFSFFGVFHKEPQVTLSGERIAIHLSG